MATPGMAYFHDTRSLLVRLIGERDDIRTEFGPETKIEWCMPGPTRFGSNHRSSPRE